MPDLNKTIDRSMAISRNVAGLYAASRQGRLRRLRRQPAARAGRVRGGGPPGREPAAMVDRLGRVLGRRRPALGAVLGHDPRARQPVDRARGGGQAAAAALRLRGARRRAHVRAALQPRARAHRAAARRDDRRHASARSSSSTRAPGHGPGIGGFKEDSRGRRRAARGPPGLLRRSSSPTRCPGRRSPTSPTPKRSSCASSPSAIRDSPKPSLIGNCQGGWAVMMLAAARPDMTGPLVINGAPMSYWAGNDGDNPMRYAGGLARRRVALAARERSRRGQVRRRAPRRELREPEPGEHAVGQALPPLRRGRHRARALPRVRALVGRLLPLERGGDPLDRQQPVRRQQARAGRGAPRARAATST